MPQVDDLLPWQKTATLAEAADSEQARDSAGATERDISAHRGCA